MNIERRPQPDRDRAPKCSNNSNNRTRKWNERKKNLLDIIWNWWFYCRWLQTGEGTSTISINEPPRHPFVSTLFVQHAWKKERPMMTNSSKQTKMIALISIRLYVFLVSCAFCFIFILPFWLTKELDVVVKANKLINGCVCVYEWKTALRGTTLETYSFDRQTKRGYRIGSPSASFMRHFRISILSQRAN